MCPQAPWPCRPSLFLSRSAIYPAAGHLRLQFYLRSVFVDDCCKRFGGLGQLVWFVPPESGKIGQFRPYSQRKGPSREIFFRILQIHPARGDKPAIGERRPQRLDVARASAAPAREYLDDLRP